MSRFTHAVLAATLLAGLAGSADAAPIKLDVLFVVDDSSSMLEEQQALATQFPGFMTELGTVVGGLPDVHIGVVSSDVGIGPFNVGFGCPATNDDGALQKPAGCTTFTGNFISDEVAADGVTRVPNYTGTLEDNFACLAKLGNAGCGFEQHLESMRLALADNPTNAGFLRPDAYLAVIILADEDDCSAIDHAVFDPNPAQDNPISTLGPLNSFRCTEFGVKCDGQNLSRTAASYANCEPRTDSYIRNPQDYVDFLKSLKADPSMIIVSVIAGNPSPVAVALDGSTAKPTLQPSCTSAAGTAAPAVRFQYLVSQFPGRATFTSICASDVTPALTSVVDALGGAAIGPDAGPAAADAGAPDAGDAPDAATGGPDGGSGGADASNGGGGGGGDDEGGCGCHAGGHSRSGAGGAGLALLGLAACIGLSRRRRA